MKWITGIGQRFGQLVAGRREKALTERFRRKVVALGLERIFHAAPDEAFFQRVLAQQETIDALHRLWNEGGHKAAADYDGLTRLAPLREQGGGYVIITVQNYLTSILEQLIRTPRAETIANVVFQSQNDPSAHLSILERGHGLAFPLTFYPLEDEEAMLCEFFHELTAVSLKAATFAIQAGAPVVPVWCRVPNDTTPCIEIAPPLEGHSCPRALTLALLDHFEQRIQASPDEMDWESDCWYPPARRLLPSRFDWPLEHPPERADRKIKPLRLLVRTPDTVREACLAVLAVRALKRGRPDVRLTVLTESNLLPFWSTLAECDACLTVNPDSPGEEEDAFDLGILLSADEASASELRAHRVARVVGMETHPSAQELDEILNIPPRLGPPEHRHRTYLRVAHRLGAEVVHDDVLRLPISPPPPRTKLSPDPEARSSKKTKSQARPKANPKPKEPHAEATLTVMGVAPGGEDGSAYRWPTERFVEVIRQAAAQAPRLAWKILLEGETDRASWDALREELSAVSLEITLVPDTIPARLEALEGCQTLLANDNDLLHLAATVHGTPTIAIYGPSDPIQTAPVTPNSLTVRRHVECTPCFLDECPLDHRCLNEIQVGEVISAIEMSLEDQGVQALS